MKIKTLEFFQYMISNYNTRTRQFNRTKEFLKFSKISNLKKFFHIISAFFSEADTMLLSFTWGTMQPSKNLI